MKILCIFLISIATSFSKDYYVEPILRQENVLASNGQYKFGFDSKSQNVEQFRTSDGIIRGSYSYLDDEGKVQHMEYLAGPDGFHVFKNNLPVTVASVTETPEVAAARKTHEETYNFLKSTAEAQRRVPDYLPEKRVRAPIIPTSTSTSNPLVQNYVENSLRNRYDTLEEIRKPFPVTMSRHRFQGIQTTQIPFEQNTQPSRNNQAIPQPTQTTPIPFIQSFKETVNNFPTKNYYNTLDEKRQPIHITKSIPTKTRNDFQETIPRNQEHVPKISPENHLEALRKAIAAQLIAYKNVPAEIPQETVDSKEYSSGYRTELISPVKVDRYSVNSARENREKIDENDKFIAIAAAKALMNLLKENS